MMEQRNETERGVVAVVGITGGIGSGKSVVSRILRLRGMEVYDCDIEARRLMHVSESLRSSLTGLMGEGLYDEQGHLDRALMARRIFSDAELLRRVNAVVHGAVSQHFAAHCRECGRELVFVESAVLRSSGLAEMCDAIWLVEAEEELRLKRALVRGGISREDLMRRMHTQREEFEGLPPEKTLRILNDGSESLIKQIKRALARL